ncbi:MAG TPA: HYR domain-containing protein [Bacteroidales bacterium]|nr:HYR domain-containing protein [Bacteroidales bacterium]HPS17890.1 HYR domain-containing protein [Bacteroidales bacterium]
MKTKRNILKLKTYLFISVVFLYTLFSVNSFSQILSNNAFLKGNYVEVGISPCGTFGSSIAPPSGYHPRGNGYPGLGFVADPAKDGWAVGTPNFIGDYFLPGTPEEGWGLTVNGVNYNNNLICSSNNIPGSIINYNMSSTEVSATWQGIVAGLSITARTYMPLNSLYFITEVTIVNTSASTINNVYYMRNVDPDQEQPLTGNFVTNNAVISQNPNSCNRALARATGLTYGSYLGLGSIDSRAKVTYGGFSNRSALGIWNGTGLFTSGSNQADQAISIAFNLGNLAPNQVVKFAYAYILSEVDLNTALAATNVNFNIGNVNYTTGSNANICSGTGVPITLTNTGTYTSWTWTPTTGLNTYTGTSVIANITSPTTYTATGSGTCGSIQISITLNPVAAPAVGNAGTITGPSKIILGSTGNNYSIPVVRGATSYNWTLPPGSVVTAGANTNSITFNASNTSWCGDVVVTPINNCNTGGSATKAVCLGNELFTGIVTSPLCSGQSLNVTYTASGIFAAGNIFTVQLSDATGNFTTPVSIGSLTSTALSGSIPVTIPSGLTSGTAYRIRVTANSPVLNGIDNGSNITINPVPVVLTKSFTTQLDASGNASIVANDVNNGSGDACGIAAISVSPNTFTCANIGNNNVTLTVTDVNGNSASATAVVTVQDKVAPVITCPGDQTQNATQMSGAYINDFRGLVTVTDNCDNAPVLTQLPIHTPLTQLGVPVPVTITATDASGNTSSCTFNVTLVDVTAPTIICGPDMNISIANSDCSWILSGISPSAWDIYDPNPVITFNPPLGTVFNGPQTIALTCTATDHSGNASSCTMNITLKDVQAPAIYGTYPRYASVNENCQAVLDNFIPSLTIHDDCDANPLVTQVPPAGTLISSNTVVVITASDLYGNTSTAHINVSLRDEIAPVIVCPATQTINADDKCKAVLPDYRTLATVTDNCQIESIEQMPAPGTVLTYGVQNVLLRATDKEDNQSFCMFEVNIMDVTAPIALTQNITVELDNSGAAYITPSMINNGSYDACGPVALAIDKKDFSCADLGSNTVTLTVTDLSGNTASAPAIVTVVDITNPIVSTKNIIVQLDENGNAAIAPADVNNGSADACGIVSMSVIPNAFNCSNIGDNTVTLTASDASGNTSSNTAIVTIEDKVAPFVITRNATVQLDANGTAAITVDDINNGSHDACGIASVVVDKMNFDCSNLGDNTVTLTVTDVNGNVASATAIVSVQDNIAPVITCPADITVTAMSNDCTPNVSWASVIASDNCTFSINSNYNSGDEFPVGTTVVTYTVTDKSGNAASCSFNVTVIPEPLVASISVKTFVGGYNVSCNGAKDGEATVTVNGGCLPYTYTWITVPVQTTATATGLGAGNYTVNVTDANGTMISQSITLTEPTVLVANAGANTTVYYGYTPMSCATLNATAGGAVAPYTYMWSTGATTATITVCPNTTTTYILTVKDVNGCVATSQVKVCVIDVRCEKGGNAIITGTGNKVLVCHVPSGNIKKANTICIDPIDVPSHLAHGDALGSCGTMASCVTNGKVDDNYFEEISEEGVSVLVYPNPFDYKTTISFSVPETSNVTLVVYDITGRIVAKLYDGVAENNMSHEMTFDAGNLGEGVYFYKLISQDGDVVTGKMVMNR